MSASLQSRAAALPRACATVVRLGAGLMAVLALAGLPGCAAPGEPTSVPATDAVLATLPPLRLPPSQLGGEFSLSQRLSVQRLDAPQAAPQVVDVQLELDRDLLNLAGFAVGQRVLRVSWNGQDLQVVRHPRLPPEVDVERMLRDMTLVYWPAQAIRAALPAGWTLEEGAAQRRLLQAGQLRLSLSWQGELAADSRIEILNPTEHYRLIIESRPAGEAP